MNPIRVVIGQNPKTQKITDVPGGFTVIDSMYRAALCKGVEDKYLFAMKLKWAGDWSGVDYLEKQLTKRIEKAAKQYKWKVPENSDILARLSQLAIIELAYGLGNRPNQEDLSKRKYRRAVLRLKAINSHPYKISPSAWSRTWSGRYETVYNILESWVGIAHGEIKNNLDTSAN